MVDDLLSLSSQSDQLNRSLRQNSQHIFATTFRGLEVSFASINLKERVRDS